MNGYETLEKLFQIKELEMNEAQKQYNRAIEHFEAVGLELYEVLKEKESMENSFNDQIKVPMKVIHINSYSAYRQTLEKKEKELQIKVHQARVNMQNKEERLTYAHQEVKKLEKLIENRKESLVLKAKKNEMKFIDELSVQQYLKQKIGD